MNSDPAGFFVDQGYLRLAGFHPKTRMAAARQKLLDQVKRLSGGQGLPRAVRGLPVFQQVGRLSGLVDAPGLHDTLVTPGLIDRVAQLAGRPPAAIQDTRLLLSPPRQGAWTLEGLNWHVDVATAPGGLLPGIQAFFLIDDVAPHGGATLALAGSHRAGARRPGLAPSLRAALKSPAGLERRLHDLGITLVEMSGRAGDVFLMDMRLLHTPSINATDRLRMMATCRCFLDPR